MNRTPNPSQAVRRLLLNSTELTSIVDSRVQLYQLPQVVKIPAVCMTIITGDAESLMSGYPVGVSNLTLQIDSYGITRDESLQIAGIVQEILAGYRGTIAGVFIKSINIDSSIRDDGDPPDAGEDLSRPFYSQDFNVIYQSLSEVV